MMIMTFIVLELNKYLTNYFINSAVTTIVGILIVWGTAYDVALKRRSKEKMGNKKYSKDLNSDSSGLNCTTYDLTRAINDNKKSNCVVGIGIPTGVNNNNSDENLAMEPVLIEEEKLSMLAKY